MGRDSGGNSAVGRSIGSGSFVDRKTGYTAPAAAPSSPPPSMVQRPAPAGGAQPAGGSSGSGASSGSGGNSVASGKG